LRYGDQRGGAGSVGAQAGRSGADTGQFAVESIRRWWNVVGKALYAEADRLLITADSGGSNDSRLLLWKTELATLAAEIGMAVTVLHPPSGTSKRNKIEHRLFSAITMKLAGPSTGVPRGHHRDDQRRYHQTGLKVQAALDTNTYTRGIKISDWEMTEFEACHLRRHDFHGDWN